MNPLMLILFFPFSVATEYLKNILFIFLKLERSVTANLFIDTTSGGTKKWTLKIIISTNFSNYTYHAEPNKYRHRTIWGKETFTVYSSCIDSTQSSELFCRVDSTQFGYKFFYYYLLLTKQFNDKGNAPEKWLCLSRIGKPN